MDLIECRQVNIEDYDDVMDIRDDVYDGLDYLPALYRSMMTNHVGYALTVNKTMVAFRCDAFIDDGETMLTRALRVRKGYEGRGMVNRLGDFISQEIAGNLRLKRKVFTFGNKTLLKKVEQGKATLVLQKAILFYQGLVSKVAPSLPTVTNTQIRILNKADMQKLLSSKTDTDRLFPQGRIIADWVPYRLLATNVDYFFNDFCLILGSDCKNGESVRLELMTLAVSYTVPNGIRYNIEIYGSLTEQLFSCHMAEHLRKCSTFEHENINFVIHYEQGRHDLDIITKTMQQFGMTASDKFHSTIMYAVEELTI
ncbi:histidine N-acetyltransferase-like [Mizuhopecten yessoensis]|uniref:N-acetyltransferase 16 n=1 Tax=Mizuhopecten yessoensis TaxID=6573 RepID=A0A210PLS4_MIZYE|nr:histidine N-acetyltransferase-like [Mizuhopecten yessoensis]OWF37433.1 N-acetyltransferase 16 [Mizuhopecten yessoensis]